MRVTRRLVQFGFLVLTIAGVFALRGNAERWCPFGGLETLYTYAREGNLICSLGISNLYILAGVLVSVLLLRRAFCAYACPIGAISEWVQAAARKLGVRPRRVPLVLDRTLALLKYAVLGLILYFTWSAGELVFRGYDPCYALLSRHGEDTTLWAYGVSALILLLSIFVTVPLCRWLCPLAAVFAPFSRGGLMRVKRSVESCNDCGACTRACPMGIQVHTRLNVTAARCTACLECVSACPSRRRGALAWGPPRRLGGRWPQAALVALLLLSIGAAVGATYAFPLPSFIKTRGTPPATAATMRLQIDGVTCRGTANLLVYFLERDDDLEIPGYLKLEAWPGPDPATVDVTYDPTRTSPEAIRKAIQQPYFDLVRNVFRLSPFKVAAP